MSKLEPKIKAEILAEALPYIRKFHGKTIVIKYDVSGTPSAI